MSAYYRYSGEPISLLYITRCADYILDYAQTDADAEWPDVIPRNGVIEVRLVGEGESEAMLQALELTPAP